MIDFDTHERSRWAGRATTFRDSFADLCAYPAAALLAAATVRAGDRVLDAGTGTGTVAALACDRDALVTAVDAEPGMVELTRARLPAARVLPATLPRLPFGDGEFDAAVANFVLNHVGDPAATLGELRRVVRPGGRIAVTVWPNPAPPAQHTWTLIFDEAGVERPAGLPRLAPDRDFPRTTAGLSALLTRAGLTDVTSETIAWDHRTDAEAWWNGTAGGLATAGLVLAAQDPATVARVRAVFDRQMAAYRQPDGLLALPTAALLAAATVSG